MSIYHCSIKPVQRSKGRSAVAAAAYRSGMALYDERQGKTWDYSKRKGVAQTAVIVPSDSGAEWAQDRAALWNKIELHDKRKNARPAVEVEVALPHELAKEQMEELSVGFARDLSERYRVAVDLGRHQPHQLDDRKPESSVLPESPHAEKSDPRNHHCHYLLTTWEVTVDGLGKKVRICDGSREELKDIRKLWEVHCNQALEKAGRPERVDCRTLEEQRAEALAKGDLEAAEALDREPETKIGPAAWAMAKRGRGGERLDETLGRREAKAEVFDLAKRRAEQRRIEAASPATMAGHADRWAAYAERQATFWERCTAMSRSKTAVSNETLQMQAYTTVFERSKRAFEYTKRDLAKAQSDFRSCSWFNISEKYRRAIEVNQLQKKGARQLLQLRSPGKSPGFVKRYNSELEKVRERQAERQAKAEQKANAWTLKAEAWQEAKQHFLQAARGLRHGEELPKGFEALAAYPGKNKAERERQITAAQHIAETISFRARETEERRQLEATLAEQRRAEEETTRHQAEAHEEPRRHRSSFWPGRR